MIAKLVSKNTRTVYDQKVVRLTVDVPYRTLNGATLEGKDALKYLDQRVDKHIGMDVTALEEQNQDVIDNNV